MTETSKENEMGEQKATDPEAQKVVDLALAVGCDYHPAEYGPCAHCMAAAERVVDAGWVSPEEHAEYVAMEGRFSEFLCDLTDGLLSKTNYDVRAMVQQVEQTFEKYAAEDIAAARTEAVRVARRVVASVTVLGGSSLAEGGKIAVQECTEALDRLIATYESEEPS